MKRYAIAALALFLTATVLTGCRNRSDNMNGTTEPSIMPTIEMPTRETTEPTMAPTTPPTTLPTDPTVESETETVGEDGFVDTNPTEGDMSRGRNRRFPGVR